MPSGGEVPSHASSKISKVLVANRGEIAVRVIRAAKDAGLASVAVYAEPDADAPHVRLADEAFALRGQTSAESYLAFDKILDAAAKANAPLVPGTPDPVKNADEILAFAKEHGLPIAIKAAFGGGGRGMKVAR